MQIHYWPVASAAEQAIQEPTKIGIVLPKLSAVKELRERIAAAVQLQTDQIVIADVFGSRTYVQPDSKLVSDFRAGTLWAYEIFVESISALQNLCTHYLSLSLSLSLSPLCPLSLSSLFLCVQIRC
jgi:hypothetical protein